MKKLYRMTLFVLVCLVGLPLGSAQQRGSLFLVTSRHEAELELLRPFVATYQEKGRLLLVTLKEERVELPQRILKILQPVQPNEIKQYRYNGPKSPALPRTLALLRKIGSDRYQGFVEKLLSAKSRAAGSDGNYQSVLWARDYLKSLGFQVQLHCFKRRTPDVCNVLAEKSGTTLPNEIVLVMAHLDSVGHEYAGGDDNASGTAGLLEMATVLASTPTQRSLRFFITNAEEQGLVGSQAYVASLSDNQLKAIKLAVNMDMISYNKNGVVDIETNQEFEPLAQWFAQKTQTYTKLKPNITMPAWGSDHVPFLRKKVPTVLTIEHWETKSPCYHRACDKLDMMNIPYAMEILKLNLAAVAEGAGTR